jgi:hypothetical protein
MTFTESISTVFGKYLNAKGRAMDARMFANQLCQYLKTQGVDSKVMNKGLGDATLILGEK